MKELVEDGMTEYHEAEGSFDCGSSIGKTGMRQIMPELPEVEPFFVLRASVESSRY